MAKQTTKSPRLVLRGDVVEIKGSDPPRTEVVRDVSIVLHLANGQDVSYQAQEEVVMGDKEDMSIIAQAAQADAEDRLAAEAEEAEQVSSAVKKAKPASGSAKK